MISLVRSGPGPGERLDDGRAPDAAGPIRLALDCVAGEATGRLAQALEAGGQVTVFGHLSGEPVTIRSQLLTAKRLTLRGFSLRPAEERDSLPDLQQLYDRLAQIAAANPGALPEPSAVYPLSELGAALEQARRPGSGRVQLALGD